MPARRSTLALILSAVTLPLVPPAHAEAVFAEGGLAIRGTDLVAYFTEGRPVAGNPAITHVWMEATWAFASAANRDAFAAATERYAPQFGGYFARAEANWPSLC